MCRPAKKGKSNFLQKLLPHKNNQNHTTHPRHSPPPPPAYPGHEKAPAYNHDTSMQYMAPPSNQAGMQFMHPSNGFYANHMPAPTSSTTNPPPEGFNVWCIKGYSGYVNFPKNNDSIQTLGRLETMNQIMHNHHDYNPSDFPRPRSPAPAPHRDDRDDRDGRDDSSRASTPPPRRENKIITVQCPPSHRGRNADMDVHCVACPRDKPSGYEVREIKRLNGTPFCWLCVCNSNIQDARNAWLESE